MAALWPIRVMPDGLSFISLTVASLPLTRDDRDVATIDRGLLLDDDNIPITERRFHRGTFDLEGKIFAGGRHFRGDLFIVEDLLDGVDGDACHNTTQHGNLYAFTMVILIWDSFHIGFTQQVVNRNVKELGQLIQFPGWLVLPIFPFQICSSTDSHDFRDF